MKHLRLSNGGSRFNSSLVGGIALALALLAVGVLVWAPGSVAASSSPIPRCARWFQAGHWRADVRTLLAMARWCVEPEGPAVLVAANQTPAPSIAGTNTAPPTPA